MPNVWSVVLLWLVLVVRLLGCSARALAFSKLGPYDPEDFVPERFLETTEGEAPIDPTTSWAFGFARR